jgi:hypothetical protein
MRGVALSQGPKPSVQQQLGETYVHCVRLSGSRSSDTLWRALTIATNCIDFQIVKLRSSFYV